MELPNHILSTKDLLIEIQIKKKNHNFKNIVVLKCFLSKFENTLKKKLILDD